MDNGRDRSAEIDVSSLLGRQGPVPRSPYGVGYCLIDAGTLQT